MMQRKMAGKDSINTPRPLPKTMTFLVHRLVQVSCVFDATGLDVDLGNVVCGGRAGPRDDEE